MNQHLADALGHLESFARTDRHAEGRAKYYAFLQASDAQLKAMIEYLRTKERPQGLPEHGSVEFGIVPYWVKHPPGELPIELKELLFVLEKLKLVPPPTVTHGDYDVLRQHVEDGTAVADDGTIFGTRTYEQLDPKWLGCLFNDLITHEKGPHAFGESPFKGSFAGDGSGPVKIALIGDWGTGRGAAQKVMRAALEHEPHHIVHLGDVYYSGTPQGPSWYFPFTESYERNHFLDIWPHDRPAGTSFTLNSNHEMYCGGQGYFRDALAHQGPFGHQNKTSYFLLENEHWQLFGLDSAYPSQAPLYMSGNLNRRQIDFVRNHRDPDKRSIVLTHHTGLNVPGTKCEEDLWKDVEQAFDEGQPDYWYWGHAHNGIVYKGVDRCPAARNKVEARCVGHGAVPYGFAWGLTRPDTGPDHVQPIDTVDWFATTPVDDPDRKGQVKNGFCLVTLEGDSLKEAFYDEDGRETWSRP